MTLNSPQEAYHFLLGHGLVGLCPETKNLVACMDVLVRMCSCDPADAKRDRLNQCIQHYTSFAMKAQSHSATLLSKANTNKFIFTLNNQLLTTITR